MNWCDPHERAQQPLPELITALALFAHLLASQPGAPENWGQSHGLFLCPGAEDAVCPWLF